MGNFEYILLDWDGCLAKTLDIWLDIYKEVVGRRGIAVNDDLEFVEDTFGKWEKGFEAVGVTDPVNAYKEALTAVENKMPDVELYKGAISLLQTLKENGCSLALLTSSFRHLVVPALKNNDLEKYFDCIITKDETEIGKPDPWIVEQALKRIKGKKERALIMGDSDHDILTGKNAGITNVLFYPGHNNKFYRKEFLLQHNPDHVISELLQLLDIVG